MRPPAVIVDCPIPNRHLQMASVEGDQEVETLPTKAPAQSLAHRICLGGSQRRAQNSYPQVRETLVDLRSEDAIAIMDEEAVRMIAGQRFPELLQRPCRRGMGRNVLVENLARSNLYDVRRLAATRTGSAVNWLAHPARRPT